MPESTLQMVSPLNTLKKGLKLHPNRADLKQAYGSLLIEHGRRGEGLKWMINSLEDNNATDYQYFNLQYAASGYQLLSTEELKERAEQWESTRGISPRPMWVTI